MMSEAIQQGSRESLRSQNLRPFVEGQIARDQRRSLVLALTQDFKQELGSTFGLRHEAQFIHNQLNLPRFSYQPERGN